MCFNKNINGNRDVKFLECDFLLVQWCVKRTLGAYCPNKYTVLLQQKEEDETEVDYREEDGNNNMLQASTVSNRWDPVLWYSRHGYNVSEMIKAPGKTM